MDRTGIVEWDTLWEGVECMVGPTGSTQEAWNAYLRTPLPCGEEAQATRSGHLQVSWQTAPAKVSDMSEDIFKMTPATT